MTSSSPGSQPNKSISWLKVLLHSRLWYESFEGLIDFLAFLVKKSWQNNIILIQETPANPLGNCLFYVVLAITLAPEMLESQSRARKTHIIAWNPIKL